MRHRLPLVAGMSAIDSDSHNHEAPEAPSPVRRMIGDVIETMRRAPGCRFRHDVLEQLQNRDIETD
jgi:hypothetical protein